MSIVEPWVCRVAVGAIEKLREEDDSCVEKERSAAIIARLRRVRRLRVTFSAESC